MQLLHRNIFLNIALFHIFFLYIFRKIFYSAVGIYTAKGIKRIGYKILAKIPEKWMVARYNKYVQHRNKEKTKLVKCLTFPACNKCLGYKREWYEDVVDYEFEGVMLKGAKAAE